MKVSVIIVAAGMGSRMKAGINKQFLKIEGKTILEHTLKVFEDHEQVNEIILVLREDEIDYVKSEMLDQGKNDKEVKIVAGGLERLDSVRNGLRQVTHNGIVLIHDGARPLIQGYEISEVIEEVFRNDAAVLGVPMTSTVKEVNEAGRVEQTLDRGTLWSVATPQGFKCELIRNAFDAYTGESKKIWDDSMLVELVGAKVKMVSGSYENIKITTPMDIIIGECILKERMK